MSATSDRRFTGSIPETYERLMVPMLFEHYAADLADRVAQLQPRDVLEIAAGTGVLTRALAARLPRARLTATDLNQAMLDRAIAREPASPAVQWRLADALDLPFADAGFDVVGCQFGVMFFPDKRAGYCEARRVLRPGGRFLFNVWDGLAQNDFARVATEALAELFPADPPRFMARTPHGYHDLDAIRASLAAAGFSAVETATMDSVSHAVSAADAALAYCQGTPVQSEILARDPAGLEAATRHVAAAIAGHFGNGAVAGGIRAHVIIATG